MDKEVAARDATPATTVVAYVNFCPVPPPDNELELMEVRLNDMMPVKARPVLEYRRTKTSYRKLAGNDDV